MFLEVGLRLSGLCSRSVCWSAAKLWEGLRGFSNKDVGEDDIRRSVISLYNPGLHVI